MTGDHRVGIIEYGVLSIEDQPQSAWLSGAASPAASSERRHNQVYSCETGSRERFDEMARTGRGIGRRFHSPACPARVYQLLR
jgi:hypothetical protein